VVAKGLGYRNQRFRLQKPVLVIGTKVLVDECFNMAADSGYFNMAADSGSFNMAADSGRISWNDKNLN